MIYIPILPTLLPVTSCSSHLPDSTLDIRHMSVLRVLRGSEPLVTVRMIICGVRMSWNDGHRHWSPDQLVCIEPIAGTTGTVGISNGMISLRVGWPALVAPDCDCAPPAPMPAGTAIHLEGAPLPPQ